MALNPPAAGPSESDTPIYSYLAAAPRNASALSGHSSAAGPSHSAAPGHLPKDCDHGALDPVSVDLAPVSVDFGPISATTDAAAAMLGWARLAVEASILEGGSGAGRVSIPQGGTSAGRSGVRPIASEGASIPEGGAAQPRPLRQVTLLRFCPGENLPSQGRIGQPLNLPPAAWGGAVDVAWASAFPRESEWLFPPLTQIVPTGHTFTVKVGSRPTQNAPTGQSATLQLGNTRADVPQGGPQAGSTPVPTGGNGQTQIAPVRDGGAQVPIPEGGLLVRVVDVAALVCPNTGLGTGEWRPRPVLFF
jgi:hypothetical protein